MAYDVKLAERIRRVLADRGNVVEKPMFGGIAFMVGGRMACGPIRDRLMVRIGEQAAAKHIGEPHVLPMDFTGRVMRAFAVIEPQGVRTAAQLAKWVRMAADFAESSSAAPKRVRALSSDVRGARSRRTSRKRV